MRETDVLIVGAGSTGLQAAVAAQQAGARALVCEKREDVPTPPTGLRLLTRTMVTDLILSPDGEVAGALVLDGDTREIRTVRAKAVILATGGAGGLWPEPRDPHHTGDGYAIAHRAGADLDAFHAHGADGTLTIHGGVSTDETGRTTVPGLYAAGTVGAARTTGDATGATAADGTSDALAPFGPYAVNPAIDPPLPKGFTAAKMKRLRDIVGIHLGGAEGADLQHAEAELLKLKGEADEFARARVEIDLEEFRNACEVALMLVRTAQRAGPE